MTLKNIDENAIITIISTQKSEEGSETCEFSTEGTFYQRGNKFYLFYNENEEMEMANCSVMIIAEKEKVTMRRTGDFELKLTYIKGETENTVYYMPFGKMNMTQTTHSVSTDLSDSGGVIKISYTLIMGGGEQNNDIEIKVKRK
ncbi:MAG: DUF1934 domain-containing protein [Eubacteriales bacterium]|nr:DUF1934 domain-containing protein [Eubacteriales bacterium]